jgi:hypothetical protein
VQFYSVFLELDGSDLLELGMYRDRDPLKFVDKTPSSEKALFTEDWFAGDCSVSCVGEHIVNVLVSPTDSTIVIVLSSGRYMWLNLDVNGTEVALSTEEDFFCVHRYRPSDMIPYWPQG